MNLLTSSDYNLDEVVFEHRNKMYGAYALRKSYTTHLTKGVFITLLAFLLLYVAGRLASFLKPVIARSRGRAVRVPKRLIFHHLIFNTLTGLSSLAELSL